MDIVLTKSLTFLSIVALGYILKQKKFFTKEDSQLLSKIVSRITLPSALLSSAQTLIFSKVTIMILIVAIVADLTMACIAKIVFKNKGSIERGSAMINTSGYNVANITIPFVAAFFPGTGMAYTCMFDIGNSLGWLGFTVAWANNEVDGKSKFSILKLGNTLLHSIPFLTYVVITIIGILNISLPTSITAIFGTIGSANSFLVMLMIGMMLDFKMTREQFTSVLTILSLRLLGFILLSSIVLFVLPLPILAKQIVILCIVPSAPSIAIVFSKEIGDSSAIPAFINSLALVLGILCATIALLFFV